jgi:hypothetical protein
MGTRLKKTGVYVFYSLVLFIIGLVTYFLPLRKESGYTLAGRNVGPVFGVNTAIADVPVVTDGGSDTTDTADTADTTDCDDTDDCSPDAGS